MNDSADRHDVLLFWILRVGVAMEFLGHGMLGLNHPPAWATYFAVVGIHHDLAFRMMPIVGAIDVTMAAIVLLIPFRGLVGYMALWGLWTALLRPLAGESIWEAVERAGNYGAPLALFLMFKRGNLKSWFSTGWTNPLFADREILIARTLRWTTALLLVGHGALGFLVRKPLFAAQYNYIGLPGLSMEPWVGGLEMLLGIAVIGITARDFLLFILAWKCATELLSPIAGTPIWVFIEHGGSYAAPLGLLLLSKKSVPEKSGWVPST